MYKVLFKTFFLYQMRRATVFYIVSLKTTAIFDYFSILYYRCGKQKHERCHFGALFRCRHIPYWFVVPVSEVLYILRVKWCTNQNQWKNDSREATFTGISFLSRTNIPSSLNGYFLLSSFILSINSSHR